MMCEQHNCDTRSNCSCGTPIDLEAVQMELRCRTGDIQETCERAAAASVYCGLTCALLVFVGDCQE